MRKLLIRIRYFFFPMAFVFIAVSFTGAFFSDTIATTNNTFTAGTWVTPADVVINEFMANPLGLEPNGEWTELYNRGGSSIDVNGWVLYDASDTRSLVISTSNVIGGSTTIGPYSYLVVNYQSPSMFSLNNTGDTIRLYNGIVGVGTQIDIVIYSGTIEGKTWSRMPSGTGSFSDGHDQTPGAINV